MASPTKARRRAPSSSVSLTGGLSKLVLLSSASHSSTRRSTIQVEVLALLLSFLHDPCPVVIFSRAALPPLPPSLPQLSFFLFLSSILAPLPSIWRASLRRSQRPSSPAFPAPPASPTPSSCSPPPSPPPSSAWPPPFLRLSSSSVHECLGISSYDALWSVRATDL
jgi:hypothetical protein